jgi:YD repeat-containing protein
MKILYQKNPISLKVFLICSLLIILRSTIYAQTNPVYDKMPKLLTPSADAAALGRYGDYSVDLSTGVPGISIPIYDIELNGFKIPVSISYHAAGNMVDDIASVVGLGWMLSAGGSITRTVNSRPDEYNTQTGDAQPYICRYKTREQLLSLTPSLRLCEINSIENTTDLESDFYSFSFNGYSGRFAYNPNGDLVLSSYDDLKITGGPRKGFIINTPDGASYYFFDGDSLWTNMVTSYKSNWYLNKIITPNSDIIEFKYKKSSITGDNHPSFNCYYAGSTWKYIDYTDVLGWRYIDKILFKGSSVNFSYVSRSDRRPLRLQYINVVNQNGVTIKKVRLGQSYFESYGANPGNPSLYKYYSRLRLDSLKITDPLLSSNIQTFTFGYDNTSLPPYFLDFSTPNSYYGQDYWGYFNGVTSNNNLIPLMNPCSMTSSDRSCNETAMQATILKKITYPTGGRTEYEYEANRNTGNVMMGGLRIKSIKNYVDNTSSNPVLIKAYEYPTGGKPTAWLQNASIDDFSRWFYLNLASGYTFNYTSVPIGRISFTDGPTVKYDQVIEYSGIQNEMKSVYFYDVGQEYSYNVPSYFLSIPGCTIDPIIWPNGLNGPQLTHHYYPATFYKDRLFQAGQLKEQMDYKKDVTGYKLVRDIINTWTVFREQDNVVVGLKLTSLAHHSSCLTTGDPECIYQYFNILWDVGVKKMTRSTETIYQDDGTIESAKTSVFEYGMINSTNGHTFATKEKMINSNGDTIWKSNRYLPEVYPSPTGVYQTMKGKNMISTPLEIINGRTIGSTNYYTGSSVCSFNNFANIPKVYQIKELQLSSPSLSYTNMTDSRLKIENTFDSYDQNGNLVSTTPTDNISTGYQWGYNGKYVVARVKNAKNLINYTDGTTTDDLVFQSNTFNGMTGLFTQINTGNITLTISYGQNPGTNKTATFNYFLSGPVNQSGTLCVSSGSGCGSFLTTKTYASMPAGAYSLQVIPMVNDAASSVIHFRYTYNAQSVTSTVSEFYYQGFEEYSGATITSTSLPSYAGKYFKTGSFTVPFTIPNGRSYIIEYHYWDGSKWVNASRSYTSNMTLSEGSAFDEIRVYPGDAQMTSYTYNPLVGMTSSTDENNVTTTYEYDGFGHLKCIKDDDGHILKTFEYHYKQ